MFVLFLVLVCCALQSCSSIEEAAALVTMAKASRAVGETRANARSSRSHLIVRVKVEVLQLSDLAGGASPSPAPPSPTASSPTRRPPMAPAAAAKEGKPLPASVTFSTVSGPRACCCCLEDDAVLTC